MTNAQTEARAIARCVRGCATDDQYVELIEKIATALAAKDAELAAKHEAYCIAHDQAMENGQALQRAEAQLAEANKALDDKERDAARWNALLRCARIRMQGSAGFNPKTGERQKYSNSTGKYVDGDSSGWVHFGAEFWSAYPGAEDYDGTNQWGIYALTALADDVMLKEDAARRAREAQGGQNG